MKLERLSSKKGFTMVELVIVITILAILSIIGIQQVGSILGKSRATADLKNAELIGNAVVQAIASEQIVMNSFTMASTKLDTSPGTFIAEVLKGSAGSSVRFTSAIATTAITTAPTLYLQTIPVPKQDSAEGQFSVGITDTGLVTVSVGAQQLYPKPASFDDAGKYKLLN